MKAIRRFGLIIAILLLGLLIGKLGYIATIVVFSGLFLIWFMLWDERKYDQRTHQPEEYDHEPYDYFEEREDYYYVDYDHHFHKSA